VTARPRQIIVTDANVLINLMHVSRLDICARLPDYEFVVPDHVQNEIENAEQRVTLTDFVTRAILRIEPLTDIGALTLFTRLIVHLGRGEAACLSLAATNGWIIASDEKRRFRREAEDLIGKDRIVRTPDLFVLAIRAGLMSIEEADADKTLLERHRFRMDFTSFRDLVR
jgi:predicted nucleic acid-binding protein